MELTGTNWPITYLNNFFVVFASTIRFWVTTLCGVCVSRVFDGGYSGGVTPGPIPNPEAKPASADGTALVRVWESRTLPSLFVKEGGFRHLCRDPPFFIL